MKSFNLLYIAAAMLGMGIANAIYKKKWAKDEAELQKTADEQLTIFMNSVNNDLAQRARESFNEVIKTES